MINFPGFNNYVTLTKFRMETVSSVLESIRKEDVMFSIDLKDSYFLIQLCPDSRPCFRSTLNGKVFQVLVCP